MRLNPKILSLFIAALITGLVLIGMQFGLQLNDWSWWMLALVTFGATFGLTLAVLELMLFQEIRKISKVIQQLTPNSANELHRGNTPDKVENFRDLVMSYTEIKQMEIDQLKSMAAYRREFLADISHELKTPIFAAQGYVHTLLDGAVDDSNVKMRFLKKAAKSLDGLDVLVQDLLILSSLETGQITMDIQSFNIYELVSEVFEQLDGKALKKSIKLGFGSGAYKNIVVKGDQYRIKQILQNLVLNGINYTESGGKVIADFETKYNSIVIHIKDNGMGIQPEHLDRIFERFYRVEKSRGKSYDRGGTGLGLAIVKHILEQHQSQIMVKSTVNKGSDFYFELPKSK